MTSSTMNMQTAIPAPVLPGPDLAAVKQRQQATWAGGDYAVSVHRF